MHPLPRVLVQMAQHELRGIPVELFGATSLPASKISKNSSNVKPVSFIIALKVPLAIYGWSGIVNGFR